MYREAKVYLEDILDACQKIERYTIGMDYTAFIENDLVVDAVIKNIMVIGEAVKKVPMSIRIEHPHVEWRKIAGMRDMLIHGYFSINYQIVWDVVINKIPQIKVEITNIISGK